MDNHLATFLTPVPCVPYVPPLPLPLLRTPPSRSPWSCVRVWLLLCFGALCSSADPNQTLYQVYKWQIISASLNLLVIVVFGGIYEEVANALNTWENHRTEQEFENALIVKIFVFQFINNYFVLFYIAFLQVLD